MRFLSEEETAKLNISHFQECRPKGKTPYKQKSHFGQTLKSICMSGFKGIFRIIFRIGSAAFKLIGTFFMFGFPLGIYGIYKDYVAIKTHEVSWQHILSYMYSSLPILFIILPFGLLGVSAIFSVLADILEPHATCYPQGFAEGKEK